MVRGWAVSLRNMFTKVSMTLSRNMRILPTRRQPSNRIDVEVCRWSCLAPGLMS